MIWSAVIGSAKSLYEQAKEEGAVITLEGVKNFMEKQRNRQIQEYQNYTSITAQGGGGSLL